MLAQYCPEVDLLAAVNNISEAAEALQNLKPDLVFLDVEMPLGSGFEFIRQNPQHEAAVIFVTAHEHYALKALKAGALDYLLKPLDIDDLQAALRKMAAKISPEPPAQPAPARSLDKLAIPTKNGVEFVAANQVLYLKADGSGAWIFLQDGRKMFSSRNLGAFEAMLPGETEPAGDRFFRVHHATLVNLRFAKNFNARNSVLTLENGQQIEVSQRKRRRFLEIFKSA